MDSQILTNILEQVALTNQILVGFIVFFGVLCGLFGIKYIFDRVKH